MAQSDQVAEVEITIIAIFLHIRILSYSNALSKEYYRVWLGVAHELGVGCGDAPGENNRGNYSNMDYTWADLHHKVSYAANIDKIFKEE